jgi:hypothetical protein
MKKAILTFGLFSMMMVLTSFTGSDTAVMDVQLQTSDTKGGQQVPPGKGIDYDTKGGQQVPPGKGIDYDTKGGQQVPPGKGL